jgi:UDP-glucose 4-epimerase
MTSTILLTGGAGYIGSHAYLALVAAGHHVLIIDNFCNARPDVIDRLSQITGKAVGCIEGDVRDAGFLSRVFADHRIDAVVHFAALKSVGESVMKPLEYFDVNVGGLTTLLGVMNAAACKRLVFSSSATVYGIPDETPTPETAERRAMNPYGQTKIDGEELLEWLQASDPSWAIGILRYFNPAGAHPSGLIGEDPRGIPNNLMPYIADVATGVRPEIAVFGNDYHTVDGTGVRDYIHVDDLARGHLLSLTRLLDTGQSHLANLGTGQGYSVLQVIAAYARAAGRDLPHRIVDRRPGDVPVYCARTKVAADLLGFKARHSLDEMCESSWHWIQRGMKTRSL